MICDFVGSSPQSILGAAVKAESLRNSRRIFKMSNHYLTINIPFKKNIVPKSAL